MHSSPHDSRESAQAALGQRLYDNMYLLLGAGLFVMFLLYTAWGLWEITSLPSGTLP